MAVIVAAQPFAVTGGTVKCVASECVNAIHSKVRPKTTASVR